MNRLALFAPVVAVTLFAALAPAHAQEEAVSLPVVVQARASGELTVFMGDGGCMCQPVSRVPAPPYACNGTCAVQRARARSALADAVDGGALNQ